MAYYSNTFGQPYINQFHQEHAALERLASGVVFESAHVAAINLPRPSKRPRKDDIDRSPAFPLFRASTTTSNVTTPELRCLPLLDVSVDVQVTSTISRTTLTQTFSNFSATLIADANYTFPLYDGTVITSFRVSVGHDKTLEGKIKPKREARAEYKQAVAEQRVAALLEEHTPEVFETHLGNIPARSTVKVEIQYVNELKADIGGEGVLVTIPTSVAPRYGLPPPGFPSSTTALGNASNHGLSVTVNVTGLTPIRKLESRTHPISVEMGAAATYNQPIPTTTFSNFAKAASSVKASQNRDFDPNRAIALLADSTATLGKDFVLLILSSGSSLVESRAVMEAPIDGTDESAMMVTLCPQDLFVLNATSETSNRFEGEIIFVADRSGSMMGEKINTLRETLGVFLKSLPEKSFFNIYSFGDNFSSLWGSSQEYTQQSLDAATHHLSNGFDANMGGTEILSAIAAAFENRIEQRNFTTQIMVLTDGEVWDTEKLLDYVAKSREKAGGAVRFFALGIGDSVSHRLIEGIGRQGGGYAEVVAADGKGKWAERVIRMLKGALMPTTWQCEVEIDGLTAISPRQLNTLPSSKIPGYIRAPYHLPSLHTFARRSIFFLFPQHATSDPQTVNIRAKAASGEAIATYLTIKGTPAGTNAIHHLAAKAAMLDLEIGRSWMHQDVPNASKDDANVSLDDMIRKEAERIGTLYKVTGRWTSFIAVDNNTNQESMSRLYKAQRSELSVLTQPRGHFPMGVFSSSLPIDARISHHSTERNMPALNYSDEEEFCSDMSRDFGMEQLGSHSMLSPVTPPSMQSNIFVGETQRHFSPTSCSPHISPYMSGSPPPPRQPGRVTATYHSRRASNAASHTSVRAECEEAAPSPDLAHSTFFSFESRQYPFARWRPQCLLKQNFSQSLSQTASPDTAHLIDNNRERKPTCQGIIRPFARTEEPPRNTEHRIICCRKDCLNLDQTFDRKCERSKHMDKHDRPYKCTIAGCENLRGYTYSGGLLRHEREVHRMHGGSRKSLFCPFADCKRSSGQGFTRKENLAEHIRRVHRSNNIEREITLQDLVAIQTAAGSFPLDSDTRQRILNKMGLRLRHGCEEIRQEILPILNVQGEALDTSLVIRFICVTYPEEKQLWELMVQKAERWVRLQLPERVDMRELEGFYEVQPKEQEDKNMEGVTSSFRK